MVLIVAVAALWWCARFVAPRILGDVLVREVEHGLGLDVHFSALRVTLVPLRLSIDDLAIADAGDTVLSARHMEVNVASWRSIWNARWVGSLIVERPVLSTKDAPALWRRLEPRLRAPSATPTDKSPFRPRVIEIHDATLDLGSPRDDMKAEVRDLSVEGRMRGLLRPTFEFETSARCAVFRRGQRLGIDSVAIRGKISASRVLLETLTIEGAGGRIRAAGSLEGDRLAGRLDWRPALDPIFALIPEAGVVRGGGTIGAKIAGTLDEPEVDASLRAERVRIHEVEFSGDARLRSRGGTWTLEDATADILGGQARGTAHGSVTALVPFEATARFTGWQPATFVRIFHVDTPLIGDWSGDAKISGDLFGDDLTGGGKFTLAAKGETLNGTASFTAAKERAEVEGTLTSNSSNVLRVRYRMVHDREIAGDVELRTDHLSRFATFVGLALDGAGKSEAKFLGTPAEPRFAGNVDFTNVTLLGIPVGAARGPFEIGSKGVSSSRFEIADGEIIGAGRVAVTPKQDNDATASLQSLQLRRLRPAAALRFGDVPEMTGTARGKVQFAGPWSALRLALDGDVADMAVAGEEIGGGRVSFAGGAEQWSGATLFTRKDGATVEARGRRAAGGEISGHVAMNGVRLEAISPLHRELPALRGTAELRGDLAGTVARPKGSAGVTVAHLAIGDVSLGDALFRLTSDGTDVTFDGGVGGTHANGKIAVGPPYAFRAAVRWTDFDAGPLIAKPAGLQIVSSGEGEIAGDRDRPLARGGFRVARLTLGRRSAVLSLDSPTSVVVANGAFDVTGAVLTGSGQRIVATARWSADEARFRASLGGTLSFLESLSKEVVSARGAVDAELEGSRRTGGDWGYRGRVNVSKAAIDLALLEATTDVTVSATIANRSVTLNTFEGKIGGGNFRFAGALVLGGDCNLDWTLHEANLGIPSWLDYRLSGHGNIGGPLAHPRLAGEVEVDQAIYDRKIEWAEFLPWFRKQTRASPSTSNLPIDLDLHVFADGGLFVDNNLTKTELRGDARVRGGASPLTLDGTVEVVNGEFSFRRRHFDITSGVVRFNDERSAANPDLAFSGETRVATRDEEYQITVQVTGTADDPRIQFSADDPSLTENDVLALVTFGRTVAQLQSQGAGIELGEALALTAGPRGEQLQNEIHTLIPVDRIEIEPSFSRVNGTTEPRLSVGKDLTEQLSAVIGTGLGSERAQDVSLEYKLTRRFSLQGLWESQTKNDAGAFGANFKFRAPFRKLPRFSLLPQDGASR